MGIIKRSADLVYTFRLIRFLTMKWEDFDAYKLGIIDEKGKRRKETKIDTPEKKDAYTPFIRLAVNIKRLVRGNRLLGFASGLFLIREKFNLSDKSIQKILTETGIDLYDILSEGTEWFILEDGRISPGIYRLKEPKMVNSSFEEIALAGDKINVIKTEPVGDIFGFDIYEAKHLKTGQLVYITTGEIVK